MINFLIGDTTYVSGTINTNTIWTPEGSPYVITGNVIVNLGVRLDIQPGVKILFSINKYLMIKGTLKAIGTSQDSIIFTGLDTTQRWQRLWIKSEASACTLKYCKISYANYSAIYNEDTLYIGYCTITNNYTDLWGGGVCNFGTAMVMNNVISVNYASNDGAGIGNFGKATIINNLIFNNIADAYGESIYN
ncbi:MAG: hypothetical protein N2201_03775 [candidate division WOR-3 bacterium]|nr:hypothetical protein [candidate division WOR-3 bacterium]